MFDEISHYNISTTLKARDRYFNNVDSPKLKCLIKITTQGRPHCKVTMHLLIEKCIRKSGFEISDENSPFHSLKQNSTPFIGCVVENLESFPLVPSFIVSRLSKQ